MIGWKFGAKNQHLIRQYLEHSAIRLLCDISISNGIANGMACSWAEKTPPNHLFSTTFLPCMSPQHNKAQHHHLSCCRYLAVAISHEDMAFFVFCGHVVTVRQGFLKVIRNQWLGIPVKSGYRDSILYAAFRHHKYSYLSRSIRPSLRLRLYFLIHISIFLSLDTYLFISTCYISIFSYIDSLSSPVFPSCLLIEY